MRHNHPVNQSHLGPTHALFSLRSITRHYTKIVYMELEISGCTNSPKEDVDEHKRAGPTLLIWTKVMEILGIPATNFVLGDSSHLACSCELLRWFGVKRSIASSRVVACRLWGTRPGSRSASCGEVWWGWFLQGCTPQNTTLADYSIQSISGHAQPQLE
jgi:hypothetical protein